MIVKRVVSGITLHLATRVNEWVHAFGLLLIGIQLLRPGDTFDHHFYYVMRDIAPKEIWATIFLSVSTIRLIALGLNGTFSNVRRFSPYARSFTALFSSIVWAAVALATGEASPHGIGFILFLCLSIGDFSMWIIIGKEVGDAERIYRRGAERIS